MASAVDVAKKAAAAAAAAARAALAAVGDFLSGGKIDIPVWPMPRISCTIQITRPGKSITDCVSNVATWERLPGELTQVAIGKAGLVAGIGPKGRVWRWTEPPQNKAETLVAAKVGSCGADRRADGIIRTTGGDCRRMGGRMNGKPGDADWTDCHLDWCVARLDPSRSDQYKEGARTVERAAALVRSIDTARKMRPALRTFARVFALVRRHRPAVVLSDERWHRESPRAKAILAELDRNAAVRPARREALERSAVAKLVDLLGARR